MRRGRAPLKYSAMLVGLATLLVCLQLLMPQAVLAHANLARAEPAPNSVWEKPPGRVTIWFTEPIEAQFSEIQVLDAQGQRVDNGDSLVDRNNPTALSVMLRPMPNGTYTVAWKNVSSVDGHSVRGSYLFSVGEPIVGAPATIPSQPLVQSPAEPVLRWLLLVGILAVVGGLSFELAVWRPVLARQGASEAFRRVSSLLTTRTNRITWLAMVVFLGASIGQLLVQAAGLNGSISFLTVLTQTDWGKYWLWRMALFVLVAGFLGAAALSRSQNGRTRSSLNTLALVIVGELLLTISLVSHGAATRGIRLEAVFSDYLHLLAAGFWVGGLIHFAVGIPLLVSNLPPADRRAALSGIVPRFSTLAMLSVGTLIITGVYSAWAQVTVIPAVATPYGLTLLAKVALLVPLLLLGALNLLWIRPRLSREGRAGQWLRWFVTSEAILAALVLLAVGLLTSLEPARQVASRQGVGQEQTLTFRDSAEGANISLEVEPARVGANRFVVSLKDRVGNPITNASVGLGLRYMSTDIGEIAETAVPIGQGKYVLENSPISIAGPWQVELVIRRPDAFDARTAFRFQVASGAGSAAIIPSPNTGEFLLGIELVLLGLLFLGVGLPLGGWWTRRGAGVMAPGVVAVLVGLLLVANLQLTRTQTSLGNPFPPNPQSLEVGRQIYTQNCQVCHGVTGKGDGPLAPSLNPRSLDLTVHVPLHPEAQLYTFISKGIPGTAMAAWEKSLTPEELWHVINYLKTLAPQ